MAKYALLVGINKFKEPGSDLEGCINDVNDMAEALRLPGQNVFFLKDSVATKENILHGLSWLMGMASPGDDILFHQSSHGSQVRDRDGDKGDRLDLEQA